MKRFIKRVKQVALCTKLHLKDAEEEEVIYFISLCRTLLNQILRFKQEVWLCVDAACNEVGKSTLFSCTGVLLL